MSHTNTWQYLNFQITQISGGIYQYSLKHIHERAHRVKVWKLIADLTSEKTKVGKSAAKETIMMIQVHDMMIQVHDMMIQVHDMMIQVHVMMIQVHDMMIQVNDMIIQAHLNTPPVCKSTWLRLILL